MKLSIELLEHSASFANPLRERELDLRGNKIPVIENLGAARDQHDVLDLTDNELSRLESFPLMKRLKVLLLGQNRIAHIASHLERSLPSLDVLHMAGNAMQELQDLKPLQSLKSLRVLCLLDNPVAKYKHYRLYVAFHLPQVKVLDYNKITKKEREEAQVLYGQVDDQE